MSLAINPVTTIRGDVGEGPLWNSKTKCVTWVDITGLLWHITEFDTGKTKTLQVPNMVGALIERESGGYLGAVKEGFAEINPLGGYDVFNEFLPITERMNDAKADALGRWWTGSNAIDFTKGAGKLHVIDNDRQIKTVLTGLTLPNGLAWNKKNDEFYLVDTFESIIWAFDFDLENSELTNKRELVKFEDNGSFPDGMTISDQGFLIVAMWEGSKLEIFDTNGAKQGEFTMPVKKPTSCTFGGENSDILIVTSACRELNFEAHDLDGMLLAVTGTGLTGEESRKFNG
ncbi:MAG: SMP-30/gluconolactonase/LRE family protein [Candidatus Nanopelagicales bacterium]